MSNIFSVKYSVLGWFDVSEIKSYLY